MIRTLIGAGALACAASLAHAQPSDGRKLAATCAICHGTQGQPATNAVATLAGLPREHISAQMRAFREGKREATVMHQIARGYSDAEIEAIAAWFAAQKR